MSNLFCPRKALEIACGGVPMSESEAASLAMSYLTVIRMLEDASDDLIEAKEAIAAANISLVAMSLKLSKEDSK